jgi:hypothetical protein
METQLDTTQKGFDALLRSRTEGFDWWNIKVSLLEMDKICGDSENDIRNYLFMQRVSWKLKQSGDLIFK